MLNWGSQKIKLVVVVDGEDDLTIYPEKFKTFTPRISETKILDELEKDGELAYEQIGLRMSFEIFYDKIHGEELLKFSRLVHQGQLSNEPGWDSIRLYPSYIENPDLYVDVIPLWEEADLETFYFLLHSEFTLRFVGRKYVDFMPLQPPTFDPLHSWFVSTDGNSGNDGSFDRPWDILTGVTSELVQPGDTVYARAGKYVLVRKGILLGDGSYNGSDNPGKGVLTPTRDNFKLKPWNREDVWINGGIELHLVRDVLVKDLRIEPTPTVREFATTADIDFPHGVLNPDKGCKVINCYVANCREGMGLFGSGELDIYGNIVVHNGWKVTDLRDYGIYTHNHNGGSRRLMHNLFGAQFGDYSLHMFSSGNNVRDYAVRENVFVLRPVRVESGLDMYDLVFKGNLFGQTDFRINPSMDGRSEIEFSGNHVGDLRNSVIIFGGAHGVKHIIFNNNKLHGDGDSFNGGNLLFYKLADNVSFVGDHNDYKRDPGPGFFILPPGTGLSFADWKTATGIDEHSTFSAMLPTGPAIYIRSNDYDANRCYVAIFNAPGNDSVGVDFSSSEFRPIIGQTYIARQINDYFNDTFEFTYTGAAVVFDMTGRTVATPTGWTGPLDTMNNEFACWLIERIS